MLENLTTENMVEDAARSMYYAYQLGERRYPYRERGEAAPQVHRRIRQ